MFFIKKMIKEVYSNFLEIVLRDWQSRCIIKYVIYNFGGVFGFDRELEVLEASGGSLPSST